MKRISLLPLLAALCCWLTGGSVAARPAAERPTYFELKVYHLKTARQEARVDSFLQQQYLPALRAAGIDPVGVFKP
ncbi:MAG: NIPSNAP family containing protein, partial [Hymenobacter sp.]